MRHRFLKTLCMLGCLGLVTVAGQVRAELSGQALVEALKLGGYSIYFRHERTDWSLSDDFMNTEQRFSCDPSMMRQLSDQGRQRARNTGAAMRTANIPVYEVISSPYCRCVETAELMAMGPVKTSDAVMNLRVAQYYGGRQAIINSTQALLSTPTKPGFNRLIVAHGNVAQASTPVYPGEGEAVVFKAVKNAQFEVIGRMPANQWPGN